MIKNIKLQLIISIAAIFVNLLILTFCDQVLHLDMGLVLKIGGIISVATIALTTGILRFGRILMKSFLIGMLVPIFPINLIGGTIIAAVVLTFSLMFPVVPVLISLLAKLEG